VRHVLAGILKIIAVSGSGFVENELFGDAQVFGFGSAQGGGMTVVFGGPAGPFSPFQ
jgi:hypothetical protein